MIATDADGPGPNSDIQYNIIQGNLDTAFIIDPPNTGIIMTNLKVDYEIRNSYMLVIEAVDNGDYALSSTCTVKISIVDTNDNPPKFPRTHPVNASEGKKYCKVPKFSDARNFAVIYLKFKERGQSLKYFIKMI